MGCPFCLSDPLGQLPDSSLVRSRLTVITKSSLSGTSTIVFSSSGSIALAISLQKQENTELSQKADKGCPKWPTPARVLHGSCTEDMVVLLQTQLPCPECQPAFLSDGSGHCSLCCSTATNQPTRQATLSFNSPYKTANFRDDFLVYDHTTGKTPVLVL